MCNYFSPLRVQRFFALFARFALFVRYIVGEFKRIKLNETKSVQSAEKSFACARKKGVGVSKYACKVIIIYLVNFYFDSFILSFSSRLSKMRLGLLYQLLAA